MEWELAAISAACEVCGEEWKGDVAAGEASCQAALGRWFQAHDHDVDGVQTLLAKVDISKVARRQVGRVNIELKSAQGAS